MKIFYAAEIFYVMVITLVKVSILQFYVSIRSWYILLDFKINDASFESFLHHGSVSRIGSQSD